MWKEGSIKANGKIVYNYDCGEDIEPVDENTKLAVETLLRTEN